MGRVALLLLALLAGWRSGRAAPQTSIARDPHELCRSPSLELRNLTLVQLHEYQEPEEYRWHEGAPELLRRVFRHRLLLPEGLLQRGLSNMGDPSRLERALRKLADGQGLTAVALGGSITAGHGVRDPGNGWVARVFAWLEATFPGGNHTLLNRAIPAVTSGYVSACTPELVPPGTDLVLLEFTYNDWVFSGGNRTINHPSRRGLERLLRRLLAHPARPGLLYLHYWPAALFDPPFFNDEDVVDNVLKYYGVPTLSMRNALHPLLQQQPALAGELWRPPPDTRVHPTCIGARLLADLVIGHLQHLVAGLSVRPPGRPPEPGDGQLQPFLLAGNWGHTHSACVLEAALPPLVRASPGWRWLDEGRTPEQHKWGFVSTEPGPRLEITVPLESVRGAERVTHFLVGVGGLISYQHMGSMALTCRGGCACPPMHHTMHHPQRFSMTGWRYVNVTRLSSQPCRVGVVNAGASGSGEHKIKISSVMVSARGEVPRLEGSMVSAAMADLGSARTLADRRPLGSGGAGS